MKKEDALKSLNEVNATPGTILADAVKILIEKVNKMDDIPPVIEQRINEVVLAGSKKKR
jgi:hypothetical protein